MAQEDILAGRYAGALAENAAEQGVLDQVRRDVRLLADLLDPASGPAHSPELRDFLHSPAVPPADKLRTMANVLEKLDVSEQAAGFFKVLIEHGRVGLMPRIALAFADVAGGLTGELTVVVHTARRLTEDQETRLAAALGGTMGCTVRLHQRVEPGLIAGARVTIGDRTFDGSVLGRLEELRHRLLAGLRPGGD